MTDDKTIFFYIKTPPPSTGYWADTVARVPHEMAEEYEFDGYGYPTAPVLDPAEYFNMKSISKLSTEKVKQVVDEKAEIIADINSQITGTGSKIQELDAKISELTKKRDKHKRGTYKHVKIQRDIDAIIEKMPELEKKIEKLVVDRKGFTIEKLNAQVRYVNLFFDQFKDHPAFEKVPGIAKELIAENEKALNAFREFSKNINVAFTAASPFVSPRVIGVLEQSVVKYDEVLDEMKHRTASRYESQLFKMYEEDFKNKVKEDDE